MIDYTNDYLLNLKVKIFQPVNGYRASTDAVLLSSLPDKVKKGDAVLDVGSGTGAISLCLLTVSGSSASASADLNFRRNWLLCLLKAPPPMGFPIF